MTVLWQRVGECVQAEGEVELGKSLVECALSALRKLATPSGTRAVARILETPHPYRNKMVGFCEERTLPENAPSCVIRSGGISLRVGSTGSVVSIGVVGDNNASSVECEALRLSASVRLEKHLESFHVRKSNLTPL